MGQSWILLSTSWDNSINIQDNNLPVYEINKNDIDLELNTISEDYNTESNFNKYKNLTTSELLKYKKDELKN